VTSEQGIYSNQFNEQITWPSSVTTLLEETEIYYCMQRARTCDAVHVEDLDFDAEKWRRRRLRKRS